MSDYNPYQAPASIAPLEATILPGAGGAPLPWSIGEALSIGWDRTKTWWPVLIFSILMVQGLQQGLDYGIRAMVDPESLALPFITSVVNMSVSSFFVVGLMRIHLAAVRGREPSFSMVFSGGDRWLAVLGTQLLMGLAIMVGTLLFIVPGIIAALGLSQAAWICVDQKKGPIESLQASWEMTKGQRGQLFGFGVVGIGVTIVGLLALVVGVFAAASVLYVGMAWIHLRLAGEAADGQGVEIDSGPGVNVA